MSQQIIGKRNKHMTKGKSDASKGEKKLPKPYQKHEEVKPKYMPADPLGAQAVAHESLSVIKQIEFIIKHMDRYLNGYKDKKKKYRPHTHW